MNLSHILQEEGEEIDKFNIRQVDENTFIVNPEFEKIKSFLHASNLRVAKGVLENIMREIGEDYELSPKDAQYEKGRNDEKNFIRLACDIIERELEGDNK